MSQMNKYIQQTALYGEIFKRDEDEERFKKAKLLAHKLSKGEFTIGFAGHFSAGKSSMINALVGSDLLPSGPIPTSANIVKVSKADADHAIIHQTDGTAYLYEGQHFAEAIKSFSKDGRSVALVEIGYTGSRLPKGITVMDTPGVDSTDDAHKLSTDSALHLADLVFYTMDYNHVQSELNFTFTKELLKYNENMYLIINQIDKHRETELPFAAFKKSVEDSFALWGVKPKGIFYTSLRAQDLADNDFPKVQEIIRGSIENRQERMAENADHALRKLMDEHVQFLNEEMEDRKETYQDIVRNDEWDQLQELEREMREQEKELHLLSGDEFAANFEVERKKLLESAAITPFETRELLKSYLESKSSRFKVGLLFGAKKTAEEKARRKEVFFENLETLVQPQIGVHLKALMKKSLKETGLLNDERSIEIDTMDFHLPIEEIDAQLIATDVVTGETVLNVTEQLKAAIYSAFRKMTEGWKNEMATLASSRGNETSESMMHSIRVLDEKVAAIREVHKLQEALHHLDEELDSPSAPMLKAADSLLNDWTQPEELRPIEFTKEGKVAETSTSEQEKGDTLVEEQVAADAGQVISRAIQVADSVETIPGFSETVSYLRHKADRLNGQEFTVALFGAFSAGKSSFSNALMGDAILPVSPNPTTAAINRIRPVTEINLNRTADVHLKSEQEMFEDISFSFQALDTPVKDLDDAFSKTEDILAKELPEESLHIHKTFIKAFARGYETFRNSLGNTVTVAEGEFARYVAEEERSCFVQSIDFYYDCPLTREGITLVDTPGADSINARHTDVAFEYIRNADAILFITYYNHAFARADREFLIQLGRVKDAFELDKMFFVVNAIDLAANEEEAEAVKSYVAEQLSSFGIRHPRVHGISSLRALESKMSGQADEAMAEFETNFHHFLQHDLRGIAIQALQEETSKTVGRVASLIERIETNRSRKAERMLELDKLEQEVRIQFADGFTEVIERASRNELNELIYYLLQRVFLRFGDFFKEGYSPSTFAKYPTDRALKLALEETVQMLGFDITQELKVTNLRMLNFLKKQLNERERVEKRKLTEKDAALSLSPYEPAEANMLTFTAPFEASEKYKSVNKYFKNQKAFFEKGDRDKLRAALEETLKTDASSYLGNEKEKLDQWAEGWIESEAEGLRQHLLAGSLEQIRSERSLLQDTEQLEEWRAIYAKIGQGVKG
ncbi:putative GTPase [Sporosarcina luteola]|nr:putative GTPase [Sporosarcina luteola]